MTKPQRKLRVLPVRRPGRGVDILTPVRQRMARNGVRDPRHVDLWTAVITGLVDQQISKDPGGDRWTRLIDDVVEMFLAHCTDEGTTHEDNIQLDFFDPANH